MKDTLAVDRSSVGPKDSADDDLLVNVWLSYNTLTQLLPKKQLATSANNALATHRIC
jgi:hypothetical protein